MEENGSFTVTAMWEDVKAEEWVAIRELAPRILLTIALGSILTPREVFKIMQDEGFRVDYDRLPGEPAAGSLSGLADVRGTAVTDEQAPIPGIFSRIEQRVTGALSGRNKEEVGCAWNCQMGASRAVATLPFWH